MSTGTVALHGNARPVPTDTVTFNLSRPTPDHGRTRFVLTPGVVDDEAREMFLFGYCHLLACALHEITGWPIALVIRDRHDDRVQRRWVHAGVLTPEGWFLDIEGLREVSEVERLYARPPLVTATVERMGALTSFHRAVGLAWDTPDTWWHGEFPGVGTSTIRRFAEHVLTTVDNQSWEVAA